MKYKNWIMAIIAIISVTVLYFAFNHSRAISHYNRGTEYMNQEEYDQAILCFDKAIEIKPKFAQAYCDRGSAYKEQDRLEQAISDYNKAIEIDPEFAVAYCNRAVIFHAQGEFDKAWEDVHKAQNLDYQIPPDFLQSLRDASQRQN